MLSEVRFAAFLVYFPHSEQNLLRRSRRLRDEVKGDRGDTIPRAAARIAELWDSLPFGDFLGPDSVLVPAPRHAPLKDEGALWPPRRIAEELTRLRLGLSVETCLRRVTPVPKSATAAPGKRPKAEDHLRSMVVEPRVTIPRRGTITLVDDIVTRGSMLLAGATLLKEAYPESEVQCFALIRTMDMPFDADRPNLREPCEGRIVLIPETGHTRRHP